MTILEKAREKYPDMTDEDFVDFCCPYEFGFKDCPLKDEKNPYSCSMTCKECWNREYEGDRK